MTSTTTSPSASPTSGASAPYLLRAISPETADDLRRQGGPVSRADRHPGYPCRQCLRDADEGEELILVSHDPFTVDSPYRSASPVFLHRQPCGRPDESTQLPVQLTSRQLSVRAFDRSAMMIDAAVIDGSELDATLRRFFEETATDLVHVHNATRGCWAVNAVRPPVAPAPGA